MRQLPYKSHAWRTSNSTPHLIWQQGATAILSLTAQKQSDKQDKKRTCAPLTLYQRSHRNWEREFAVWAPWKGCNHSLVRYAPWCLGNDNNNMCGWVLCQAKSTRSRYIIRQPFALYLLAGLRELLSSLTFPAAASAECAHRIMQNDTMDGAHPSILIAERRSRCYTCVRTAL